jgi:eukaryotic-like serine/threonine-protein kinase
MLGQVFLGKYVISAPLAEGGMSRLFLARQSVTGREVVVKLLKDEFLADRDLAEHFRREIHVTTHFQHPNAVMAIDSATNSPMGPVLVMEYLRGVDLHDLICRKGRFPAQRVAQLLAQLCDVLQAAHDSGIIHRDLKPGNCMVLAAGTARETLKLMDFGLSQMRSVLYIAPEEVDNPNLPSAAGTPEYICPELVRGQQMDHRGDLYSIGVILFEMLTGRRPFAAPTPDDLMLAHLREPPPRFADIGFGDLIPPAVEAVVQSCLAKNPDERPSSATEVANRFLRATGVAPPLRKATPPTGSSGMVARPTIGPVIADRNAFRHSIEAVMPEAMAMVKIKGFIHDLGGSVVDSVPGLIKVRLPEPAPPAEKSGGLLARRDHGSKQVPIAQLVGATDMELHMEREDPAQPNRLTVTLLMRPTGRGLVTPAWRTRCGQIGRDLQAYLMGR